VALRPRLWPGVPLVEGCRVDLQVGTLPVKTELSVRVGTRMRVSLSEPRSWASP
jgi:hypothetical protein